MPPWEGAIPASAFSVVVLRRRWPHEGVELAALHREAIPLTGVLPPYATCNPVTSSKRASEIGFDGRPDRIALAPARPSAFILP